MVLTDLGSYVSPYVLLYQNVVYKNDGNLLNSLNSFPEAWFSSLIVVSSELTLVSQFGEGTTLVAPLLYSGSFPFTYTNTSCKDFLKLLKFQVHRSSVPLDSIQL